MKNAARPPLTPRRSRRQSGSAKLPGASVLSARPTVPVFVAYADVPAARQALSELKIFCPGAARVDCVLQPMLWRFDQLDAPRWREMALRDAARAGAIVLALGECETLGGAVESWLRALAAHRPDTGITLVGVLDGEPWTICLQKSAVPRRSMPVVSVSDPVTRVTLVGKTEAAEAA